MKTRQHQISAWIAFMTAAFAMVWALGFGLYQTSQATQASPVESANLANLTKGIQGAKFISETKRNSQEPETYFFGAWLKQSGLKNAQLFEHFAGTSIQTSLYTLSETEFAVLVVEVYTFKHEKQAQQMMKLAEKFISSTFSASISTEKVKAHRTYISENQEWLADIFYVQKGNQVILYYIDAQTTYSQADSYLKEFEAQHK
jgi:hypothetical protein